LAVLFALLMATSVFAGTVTFAGTAAAAPGDVLHRANAGGSITSTSGPDWQPATDYLVTGGGETSSHGQPSSIDDSVPSGTPSQIWEAERWDPGGGDEMQYEFGVPSGQQVEVRLYFYDGYSGTSSVGDRVFDVSVEDQTVENFDIIEQYGDDTGAMKSFTVTSDGTIDVDFAHVTENPQINAIEIVSTAPQPDELGGPSSVDFGSVLTGNSETKTVTVTNLGGSGDPGIDISGVSVTGTDAGAFSAGSASQTTLAPGESADIPVTFSPSSVDPKSATLEVSHSGSNSPLAVSLSGEGASAVDPSFSKSTLQGFSAGNPTAIDFGPDGRVYVSTQGGTVYALDVERNGENDYQVVNEVQIDAIKQIPNHDDFGNLVSGENNRQITGLTAGGTAANPVVYVSSSDPEIDVGQDDDDTDTNSGAISRLTINPGSDGTLQASEVGHDVMVLGLPRSEENHATNGLDLSADGDTLYVAQGGHTNKGAPGDNFGHTPEYALSAAVLEIDLAQIEGMSADDLQNYDSSYPSLDFYYSLPTIGNDDVLPFGGNDGMNQAKLVEGGPVQIYSPGYRNPYDLVLAESGQLYVSDHGPNGGWGGQPADANGNIVADASSVTNHPNEGGSFSTSDQLIAADEGEYGGHAAPIRANPTGADIYDANGDMILDITSSNSPVPSSMVNPVEADYIPPTGGSPDPGAPAGSANTMETTSGQKVLFGPTGGTTEYTASNFGGAMEGDILQVELGGDIERVELTADGQTATNVETIMNTGGPLGITAQDDDEKFAGTVWTANHGGNDITVFEPVDYANGGGGDGDQCTGADDASLDEDGDGYDNADEIDAGTDPCSAASTPADFDGDGTSNLNDEDDDNDGRPDTSDPFAVDPDDGTTTTLPVQHDLSELSLFGDDGQGWTGLMTNGQDDYQDLYDPTKMTVGGAAEVLTVEEVPQGDAYSTTNTQQYGFQFGVDPPDEPFVVETTVASFPENPEDFQSAGIQIGTGDQSNYTKLVVAADGGNGGVEFAQEVDDSFTHQTSPNVVSDGAVAGNDTTLTMTVDPTTDPAPNNGADEVAVTAAYEVGGETTEVGTAAVPAAWLDASDGSGLAVGVVATSNGASSTFDATWTDISVEYVTPPANAAPTADAGSDQTVDEGATVTLDASGSSDPDGDQLGYTWTQTDGPDVSLSANDAVSPTFTAPDVDGDTTLTFEVTVSDGTDAATDTVNVTVQDTDEPAQTGDVVFAVNAGGSEYTATDGTVYAADTNFESGDTYSTSNWASTPPEIGNTEDDPLYRTERYGDPVNYSVPVDDGTYQVTLEFAEIFQGAAPQDSVDSSGPTDGTNENDRLFNATLEGQRVLTNYDIYADVGALNATNETVTVEVTDGTLDIDFAATYDNAKISAIKVTDVTEESSGDATVAEAVASYGDGDDATISLQEIQTATNWWATGAEVPGTGGETISLQEMQQLTNTWATGGTVGDGSTQASIDVTSTSVDGDSVTVNWDGTAAADNDHVHVQLDDNDYVGGQSIDGSYTFENVAPGEHTVSVAVADMGHNEYTNPEATDSATVTVEEQSSGVTSADVTVNSGSSNIDASTYSGGSFEITNTGDESISSVEVDLGESAIPDAVFDPQGTAGDAGSKGLVIDSESGDGAGVVSTADGDVFSQPQNGQNADDGYKVLTVEFDDFEADETVSFSVDIDPTTIKDADTTGGEGSVSGLELSGSAVTVSSSSATVSNDLFTDGSDGGSQSSVTDDAPAAPALGVEGVTLQSTEFPAHQAATVSSASQTLTLSGPAGATVELLTVEASAPPSDGYDVDAFEADNAEAVSSQTVTLDSDGQATVPVSLSESNLNYVQAAVQDGSGATGTVSQTVVLDVQTSTNTAPSIDAVSDQTVHSGETVAVPVTASDAEGDSLTLSKSSGPSFVTLTDDGDGTGSLEIAPTSADAGAYTIEVTADDGTDQTTASVQLTVETATSTTSGTVVHRVNAGGSTITATDTGPDWTGVTAVTTDGPLVSTSGSNGNYDGGDDVAAGSAVPSSTPAEIYDAERYGAMTWEFDVTSGSEVEVRLYLSNQFPQASSDGDRQYNVSLEGDKVLTQYDPVQDVGHATGTVKAFTVTEDSDGTVTIAFEKGSIENPQVNAIEIVETSSSS
jgi:hypothetical protein